MDKHFLYHKKKLTNQKKNQYKRDLSQLPFVVNKAKKVLIHPTDQNYELKCIYLIVLHIKLIIIQHCKWKALHILNIGPHQHHHMRKHKLALVYAKQN